MGQKGHSRAGKKGGKGDKPSASGPASVPSWKWLLAPCAIFLAAWSYYGPLNSLRALYDDTTPQVRVIAAEATIPFALPFAVQNASDWFDMHDTQFVCMIKTLRIGGVEVMSNVGIQRGRPTTIARRSPPVNFRCGIGIGKDAPIETIIVSAKLTYKTLWFPREVTRDFNWISGRWVEGELH